MSALGCVVRTVLTSGSSTGLTAPPRGEPNLGRRRLTPGWPLPPAGTESAAAAQSACAGSCDSAGGGDEAPGAGRGLAGRTPSAPAGTPTAGVTRLPDTRGSLSPGPRCPVAAWVTPPSAVPAVATSPATCRSSRQLSTQSIQAPTGHGPVWSGLRSRAGP